jgi:hypothetical protein
LAAPQLRREPLRLGPRPFVIHENPGVDAIFQAVDAFQAHFEEIDRRKTAGAHGFRSSVKSGEHEGLS